MKAALANYNKSCIVTIMHITLRKIRIITALIKIKTITNARIMGIIMTNYKKQKKIFWNELVWKE